MMLCLPHKSTLWFTTTVGFTRANNDKGTCILFFIELSRSSTCIRSRDLELFLLTPPE